MNDFDPEACNTRLQLGLGLGDHYAPRQEMRNTDRPLVCLDLLSFALLPKQEQFANLDHHMVNGSRLTMNMDEDDGDRSRSTDHADSEITDIKDGARKKLRLTREQTTLLEDSFKRHNTLNPVILLSRNNFQLSFCEKSFQT